MNSKRPRRLDLNAPLLSTRRSIPTSIEVSRIDSLRGSCDGVPFLWEQSPGKPKDTIRRDDVQDKALPLPKPPPIRWQEELTLAYGDGCDVDDEHEDEYVDHSQVNNPHNNDIDDEVESSSDSIDLFSLAESLNTWEDLDMEGDTECRYSYGSSSPNFMMQRFLPAATALASSSLSALPIGDDLDTNDKHIVMAGYSSTSTDNCKEGSSCVLRPRVAGRAYSSSTGCGFEILFPWRTKHRLCGVKSPVRRVRSSLKPQFGPRKN